MFSTNAQVLSSLFIATALKKKNIPFIPKTKGKLISRINFAIKLFFRARSHRHVVGRGEHGQRRRNLTLPGYETYPAFYEHMHTACWNSGQMWLFHMLNCFVLFCRNIGKHIQGRLKKERNFLSCIAKTIPTTKKKICRQDRRKITITYYLQWIHNV